MNTSTETIMKMIEAAHIPVVTSYERVEFWPTGSLLLDYALGGGLPKGRITMLWGAESYGKTTLALMACKTAVDRGGYVAYIDAEHSVDPMWAAKFGMGKVDDEGAQHFFLIQPESAEDALNAITAMLAMKIDGKSVFQVIVLDSVASMATRDQLAGNAGDVTVASLARVLAAWTSSNKGRWTASSTALLFINQARSKIGVSYGDPDTYPGGRALRHHCSIIAKMRAQGDTLKDAGTGEIVARTLRLETKKNKVAPPFRQADVKVFIDDSAGADPWSEMAAVGRELGVFTKEDGSPIKGSCSWFLFGERVGVGEAQITAALKANKELAAQVYVAIQVGMNGQQDLPKSGTGDSNEGGNEDAS